MKGFIGDIEQLTRENENFRKVIYTGKNSQLVVMSLKPGEEIGEEIHQLDQFIKCEAGKGVAIMDGVATDIAAGFAVLVPQGARHNIVNTATDAPLKLYTVYAPPNHRDGVIHVTKEEAEMDHEEFDGKTTE